jgi:hypothetical protein
MVGLAFSLTVGVTDDDKFQLFNRQVMSMINCVLIRVFLIVQCCCCGYHAAGIGIIVAELSKRVTGIN